MDAQEALAIVDKAVPIFFALIAVELILSLARKRSVYRLNDSISDLTLGAVSQIAGLVTRIPTILGFALIAQYASIQILFGAPEIPLRNPFPAMGTDWTALGWWALAFVLVDHQYYWGHRFTHHVNVAWGAHVAHHSSEEFNLAVALRQSGTQSLFTMWFQFPLAILGFSWVHFAVVMGFNLIYQFWIHTRLIGRMGPLEWIFNTPSHHRVHHGRNPKYLDKNHAGVFILWDRLYGTFQPEEEEPIYGLTTPLHSHNPIWTNVHHYAFVFGTALRARGLRDKLRVLFGKTGWRPDYLGGFIAPGEVPADYVKYDPQISRPLLAYAIVHFVAAIGFLFVVTSNAPTIADSDIWLLIAGAGFVVFSFTNVASMFDDPPWLRIAETLRLTLMIAVGAAGIASVGAGAIWAWLLIALGAISLAWRLLSEATKPRQLAPS